MKQQVVLIGLSLLLLACGGEKEDKSLKIACASNMRLAMDSISSVFTEGLNIVCEITYGSSGTLTTQIENGAPYDVFLSANMVYPNRLFDKKIGSQPEVYAQGRLVLVVEKEPLIQSVEEALTSENTKRIAIANNKTAPYGIAAYEFLQQSGVYTDIEKKLIVGESVGSVNQYISTGAVDAGFTSYSYIVKNRKANNFFEIDQHYFSPINQGVTIIKQSADSLNAEKFVSFLLSDQRSNEILKHFGYLTF